MLRALLLLTVLVSITFTPRIGFAASPTPDSAIVGRATGRLGADWRYVHYHGHHWYWMPDSSWRVWTDTGWAMPGVAVLPQEEYRRFSREPSDAAMPATSTIGSSSPMGWSGGSQGGAGPSMGNEHFLNR